MMHFYTSILYVGGGDNEQCTEDLTIKYITCWSIKNNYIINHYNNVLLIY